MFVLFHSHPGAGFLDHKHCDSSVKTWKTATHPWLLTYQFGGKKSLDVSKAGVQCAMENTFDPFLFEKITFYTWEIAELSGYPR